jgi:hypothetical protein
VNGTLLRGDDGVVAILRVRDLQVITGESGGSPCYQMQEAARDRSALADGQCRATWRKVAVHHHVGQSPVDSRAFHPVRSISALEPRAVHLLDHHPADRVGVRARILAP